MTQNVARKASIPNPALDPFRVLIGRWNTTGTHGLVPDTILHGLTSFEWLENGAFLMMRSEIDESRFPAPSQFLVVTILKQNITCSPSMNAAFQGSMKLLYVRISGNGGEMHQISSNVTKAQLWMAAI